MHPITSVKDSYELLRVILKSDITELFSDPIMHDPSFLSRTLDGAYQPIAHTLAGIYRFQLTSAQSEHVLNIKNGDGVPLSYVLMSASCGGFSRQVREINEKDLQSVELQERLRHGKLAMIHSIGTKAPELFNSLWPLTPAIDLPIVKRTFSCIHPSFGPAHSFNDDNREYYRKNPIRLTAFDALSVSGNGNHLPTSRQKALLWLHDRPQLMRYVLDRFQQNPSQNPSLDYQMKFAGHSTFSDGHLLLLLLEHYQKTSLDKPRGEDIATHLVDTLEFPFSPEGVVSGVETYVNSMLEWIRALPTEQQKEQCNQLSEHIKKLKEHVEPVIYTLHATQTFASAMNRISNSMLPEQNNMTAFRNTTKPYAVR